MFHLKRINVVAESDCYCVIFWLCGSQKLWLTESVALFSADCGPSFSPSSEPNLLESFGGKWIVQEDQQHTEEVVSTWWFRASSSGSLARLGTEGPTECIHGMVEMWMPSWRLYIAMIVPESRRLCIYIYIFSSGCRSDIPSLTSRSRNAVVVTLQQLGESRSWSTAQPHSSSDESSALPFGSRSGGNQKPTVICEAWECLRRVNPKKALGRQREDVLTIKSLHVCLLCDLSSKNLLKVFDLGPVFVFRMYQPWSEQRVRTSEWN